MTMPHADEYTLASVIRDLEEERRLARLAHDALYGSGIIHGLNQLYRLRDEVRNRLADIVEAQKPEYQYTSGVWLNGQETALREVLGEEYASGVQT